jgi:hypothetical protein
MAYTAADLSAKFQIVHTDQYEQAVLASDPDSLAISVYLYYGGAAGTYEHYAGFNRKLDGRDQFVQAMTYRGWASSYAETVWDAMEALLAAEEVPTQEDLIREDVYDAVVTALEEIAEDVRAAIVLAAATAAEDANLTTHEAIEQAVQELDSAAGHREHAVCWLAIESDEVATIALYDAIWEARDRLAPPAPDTSVSGYAVPEPSPSLPIVNTITYRTPEGAFTIQIQQDELNPHGLYRWIVRPAHTPNYSYGVWERDRDKVVTDAIAEVLDQALVLKLEHQRHSRLFHEVQRLKMNMTEAQYESHLLDEAEAAHYRQLDRMGVGY